MKTTHTVEIQNAVIDFLADFGVYLFAIAGVLASKWIPAFRRGDAVDLGAIGVGQLVVAGVIAFSVTFGLEAGGDTKGKRRNFKRRAANAMAQGVMWQTLIGG